jgi:imidazoleglycerol-phosphate dehydratase
MGARKVSVTRTTEEAEVKVGLDLDGTGTRAMQTGSPFLDHMLDLLARCGEFDLQVQGRAIGGDPADLMEEVGFCLGLAFGKAMGEKDEVAGVGLSFAPVDDRLARAVVEISGQPCLVVRMAAGGRGRDAEGPGMERFWRAFVSQTRMALHLELVYGEPGLPAHEAVFKAAARALHDAVQRRQPHH